MMAGFTSVNGTATADPIPSLPVPPSQPAESTPETSAVAGTKRKRDSKNAMKFYAVRVGRGPGIYHTWPECLDQVKGFPKAAFKSFTSLSDAQQFLASDGTTGQSNAQGGHSKFYGVQSGRNPGVYSSWPEVLEQITGWKFPKHKAFKTRVEAELFVAEGQRTDIPHADTTMESIEPPDQTSPASKKAKTSAKGAKKIKDEVFLDPNPEAAEWEPGDGPLPEGAEDNFDPTITLDLETGTARYKTAAELAKTKYQAVAPLKDAPVRIYTDGSALDNGKESAIAGVGVYFGPRDKRNVSEPLTGTKQTNQRAELTAILRALEVAPRDRKIVIYTDSQYAINCCTVWFQKWRRNNWLNAQNKPVENKDLVSKIVDMLDERYRLNRHRIKDDGEENGDGENGGDGYWEKGPASVQFVWVKGHAKDVGNEAADGLAVNGAVLAREMNRAMD